MTMLEIFESRLPDGVAVKKATQKGSKYEVVLDMDGTEVKTSVPKTCAPDQVESCVDFSINAAMAEIWYKRGDMERARAWLNKQMEGGELM